MIEKKMRYREETPYTDPSSSWQLLRQLITWRGCEFEQNPHLWQSCLAIAIYRTEVRDPRKVVVKPANSGVRDLDPLVLVLTKNKATSTYPSVFWRRERKMFIGSPDLSYDESVGDFRQLFGQESVRFNANQQLPRI